MVYTLTFATLDELLICLLGKRKRTVYVSTDSLKGVSLIKKRGGGIVVQFLRMPHITSINPSNRRNNLHPQQQQFSSIAIVIVGHDG